MKAEIIAVGTELLLGQILNTNAQFLSVEMSNLGIDVYFQTVVGDNAERLRQIFNQSLSRCDVVLLTGGLGPTKDDLTRETVANALELPLEMHQESLDRIEQYFRKMDRTMTESNRKQAYLPKGSTALPNDNGTAPGCVIMHGEKIIMMFPGPPAELQPMFKNYAAKFLCDKSGKRLYSKVLKIFGIGESELEQKIINIINNQSNPTIAPYAKDGEVTLRITAKTETQDQAGLLIDNMEREVRQAVGQYIYGQDDDTLESVACGLLMQKNMSIAVVESCTGGMLAEKITSVAGISANFYQAAVTYSNQSKINMLGVRADTLEQFGAVSSQVAMEMAEGIRKSAGSDIGISTTGIAGPSGATLGKPVGLVYLGISTAHQCTFVKLQLGGSRDRIRKLACMHALGNIIALCK